MQEESEIASPRDVGDSNSEYLVEGFTLRYGWSEGVYFLRLARDSDVLFEWEKEKNLLSLKTVRTEVVDQLVSLGVDRKLAKTEVLKSFVQFYKHHNTTIKSQKELLSGTNGISGVNYAMGMGGEKKIFLNSELQTNNPKASIGTIEMIQSPNEKQIIYYFGIPVPTEQEIKDKEGKTIGHEIKPTMHLCYRTIQGQTNKKTYYHLLELDQKVQKRYNFTPVALSGRSRWTLEQIHCWTQGMHTEQSAEQLFSRIKEQFKKYIWFDEEQYYNILPLWVMGTYFFPLFRAYPYLNLWGMKNTGKSKVMQLSSILSFNSQVVVNMSTASLFRIVHHDAPTLFIDEAENLWKEHNKREDDTTEIVALLNAGWMKGSYVPRVEKEDGVMKVHKFDVYCPKMLASIQGLKGALESRCVRIVMLRPTHNPASQLWMEDDDKSLIDLRDDLYPFSLNKWEIVLAYYSGVAEVKNDFGLDNRDWQVWKPLLCLAKMVNDDLFNSLGKWAFEETEKNKEEDVVEDDWDSVIVKALDSMVTDSKLYYVSDIKGAVDDLYVERTVQDATGGTVKIYRKDRPSGKYIGRFFLRVGMGKYKHKGGGGKRGYLLSPSILKKVFSWRFLGQTNATKDTSATNDANFLISALRKNILDLVPKSQDGFKTYEQIKIELSEHYTFTEEELQIALDSLLKKGEMVENPANQYRRLE